LLLENIMLLRPGPLIFRKRRTDRKPRRRAPAVVNQITSVAYGPAPEVLLATVTGTLVAAGELEGLMAVTILGNEYTPIDANLDDLPQVVLTFDRDVTEATTWSVPDPVTWEFAEGTLAAPFAGNIT
jgi:hypothetical protein